MSIPGVPPEASPGAGEVERTTTGPAVAAGDPLAVAALLTEALNRLSAEAMLLRGHLEASDEDLFISDLAIALFRSSPDAILVADEDGRIQMANSQAEFLTGYHRTELRGEPVEMLLPRALRHRHATVHRISFLAEPRMRPMGRDLDLRLRRKNGEEVPVDINLSPVATERGLLVIATLRRGRLWAAPGAGSDAREVTVP